MRIILIAILIVAIIQVLGLIFAQRCPNCGSLSITEWDEKTTTCDDCGETF